MNDLTYNETTTLSFKLLADVSPHREFPPDWFWAFSTQLYSRCTKVRTMIFYDLYLLHGSRRKEKRKRVNSLRQTVHYRQQMVLMELLQYLQCFLRSLDMGYNTGFLFRCKYCLQLRLNYPLTD